MNLRTQQLEDALISRILIQDRIDKMPAKFNIAKAEDYPYLYNHLVHTLTNNGLKIRFLEELSDDDGVHKRYYAARSEEQL